MKDPFRFNAFILVVAASLGCLGGCGAPGQSLDPTGEAAVLRGLESEPWSDPRRVVAEVNGRPITQGDFYRRILRQFGTAKAFAALLTQEMVLQEAEQKRVSVTAQEVERRVDEIVGEEAQKVGGIDVLAEEYRKAGLGLDEVRSGYGQEVESQLLLAKLVKSNRKVDDDVLRRYYKATYANTRYQTRHIAYSFLPRAGQGEEEKGRLKLDAFNKAARAADKIRQGADFVSLARAESDDSVTAGRGGDLGAITEDSEAVPEFMRRVFALKPGDISDPVENPVGGYHVFQVTAILSGESFIDCREKMRKEILEQEPTVEEVQAYLMDLRKGASVRILTQPADGGQKAEKEPG